MVDMKHLSCVSYIIHQGGTRSLESLREAQGLWIWAHPSLTSLRAMHLPGRANSVADYLSRQSYTAGSADYLG